MSKKKRTQEIEDLAQRLSALKEQASKVRIEARDFAEKRDRLNDQFKKLRIEISELKNTRDRLNKQVGELKRQRNMTKTEIHERIDEIRRLRLQIQSSEKERPSAGPQTLQKKIERIEWEIQTASLDLPEENELIEQVKQLETQLNIHRKLDGLQQKKLELRAELNSLRIQNENCHEKLTETAQRSQEVHEEMLTKAGEAKELKAKADKQHQLFLVARERIRPLQKSMMEISGKMMKLRGKIREKEEKEKRKNEEALRKKLEKRAKEKLKRGEKLTWHEFQILAEKDMIAQD